MKKLSVRTKARVEMLDITASVQNIIREENVQSGLCVVFTPHTTAAVTINENADPDVPADIAAALETAIPHGAAGYRHAEGNSAAHVKSSLVGASETVIIAEGRLVLGAWQAIYFCEYDGPRSRQVFVKIIPD